MNTAPLSPGQQDDFSAFDKVDLPNVPTPVSIAQAEGFSDIDLPEVPGSLGTLKPEAFKDINLPEIPESGTRLRLHPSKFPPQGVLLLKSQDESQHIEPFFLALNLLGNKESERVSYTIMLPTGRKVLLPVFPDKDYRFSFPEVPVQGTVSKNGEIFFERELKPDENPEVKKQTKILVPERPGVDGFFEGNIHGSPFYAVTQRACGESKYSKVNEDSIAINPEEGLVAIGDGLGACELSFIISHFAVTTFVQSEGSLADKIRRTHTAVRYFQTYQQSQQYAMDQYPGDTTLVGIQIKENTLDSVALGDSKWFLVRDKDVIAQNKEHNYAAELYYGGQITEEEKFLHPDGNAVTTTLVGSYVPDFSYMAKEPDEKGKTLWQQQTGPLTLKRGDRLYVFTDGADCLTKKDFIDVSHLPPKEAVLELQKIVKERNNKGEYSRTVKSKDEKGKESDIEIFLPSPDDNLTLFAYAHKAGYPEDSPQFSRAQVRDWVQRVDIR